MGEGSSAALHSQDPDTPRDHEAPAAREPGGEGSHAPTRKGKSSDQQQKRPPRPVSKYRGVATRTDEQGVAQYRAPASIQEGQVQHSFFAEGAGPSQSPLCSASLPSMACLSRCCSRAEVAAAQSADAVLLRQFAEQQEGAAGPTPSEIPARLNFPLAAYVASSDEQVRRDAGALLRSLLSAPQLSRRLQEVARAAQAAAGTGMHDACNGSTPRSEQHAQAQLRGAAAAGGDPWSQQDEYHSASSGSSDLPPGVVHPASPLEEEAGPAAGGSAGAAKQPVWPPWQEHRLNNGGALHRAAAEAGCEPACSRLLVYTAPARTANAAAPAQPPAASMLYEAPAAGEPARSCRAAGAPPGGAAPAAEDGADRSRAAEQAEGSAPLAANAAAAATADSRQAASGADGAAKLPLGGPVSAAAASGPAAPVPPPPFGQMLPESPPLAAHQSGQPAAAAGRPQPQQGLNGVHGSQKGLFDDSSDSDAAEEVPLGPAAPGLSATQRTAAHAGAVSQPLGGMQQQWPPSDADAPAQGGLPKREADAGEHDDPAGARSQAGVGAGTQEDPVLLSSSSSDSGAPPAQACLCNCCARCLPTNNDAWTTDANVLCRRRPGSSRPRSSKCPRPGPAPKGRPQGSRPPSARSCRPHPSAPSSASLAPSRPRMCRLRPLLAPAACSVAPSSPALHRHPPWMPPG